MEPLAHPAGLERYRALLRTPYARRLFSFSLLARLPIGMTPLALLLLVRETGAGYGAAGAVSAAYFVAAAIAAPISGRLVDKRGTTSVLLPRAILSPGLLLGVWALAAAGAPLPAIAACAAAAGALLPPISAALRSLWPRLLDGPELRSSAYALEASLQEVFFVLGPLLVAVLAAVFEPGAALAVGALAGAVGTLGFALTGPVRAYRPEAERDARGFFGALEAQGVRTIVLYSACCASHSAASRWRSRPSPKRTAAPSSAESRSRSSPEEALWAGSWRVPARPGTRSGSSGWRQPFS